jgi:hypothetical protein
VNALDVNGAVKVTGDFDVYGTMHLSEGDMYVGGSQHIFGNLGVSGSKGFVQDHPTNSAQQIVYVSLEGGEAGTYFRGTGKLSKGRAVIDLPEHFRLVTGEDGLTIQLTARDGWLRLFVARLTTAQIVVEEAEGKDGQFDYLIHGVRKGFENHRVIVEKRR